MSEKLKYYGICAAIGLLVVYAMYALYQSNADCEARGGVNVRSSFGMSCISKESVLR